MVVVQKYGGSSLATVADLQRIAAAVAARAHQGEQLVVVVSAMGQSTDALLAQAQAISALPARRELDMLVTAGERISMALLCMAIEQAGVPAISFTGSQSGIITDDTHQAARILEVRPQRIEAALREGRVVIVAGYQGVSRQREVTTLGRGGSDTTAVALAAALGAQACEIYSDVDGVYSADPRVCAQARLLATLDFGSMQAMATAGARVLAAEAVDFARRANIDLVARRTGDTGGRQTRVRAWAAPSRGPLAVVGASQRALWTAPLGACPVALSQALARRGMALVALGPGQMVVDTTDAVAPGAPGREGAWEGRHVATVSVVAPGHVGAAVALLGDALAATGSRCHGHFGASGTALVAVSPEAEADLVRAAHAALPPAAA